jgi:hypothetical protein
MNKQAIDQILFVIKLFPRGPTRSVLHRFFSDTLITVKIAKSVTTDLGDIMMLDQLSKLHRHIVINLEEYLNYMTANNLLEVN